MGRRPNFPNITDPVDRKETSRLYHSWQVQIAAYQRDLDRGALSHLEGLQLSEYLGFSERERLSFYSLDMVRFAIQSKRELIKRKVENQRARIEANGRKHGVGLLTGELVALAVCYNHGEGAGFRGYAAEEAEIEATSIEDWYI